METFFGIDLTISQLIFVYFFSFFAGLIDSIAGGGGLIQLPALLAIFPTAPTVYMLGTNKLASSCGTALATARFAKSVEMRWRKILPMAVAALIMGVVGALIAINVPNHWLRPLVIVLMAFVLIYTFFNGKVGDTEHESPYTPKQQRLYGLLAAGAIGLYDGFFGPGTGNFLILTLIFIYGLDFLHASASGKIINLATNIGALILFFKAGTIYVTLALTMAIFNMAGAYFGVKLAVLKGSKFIRVLYMVIVLALLIKQVLDLLT